MRPQKRKILAAVLVALVLITAVSGAVYGYLSAGSNPVENTFTPATQVAPTILTDSNGEIDVNVGNPGYSVYVRAAIVVTWQKEDKTVHAWKPEYSLNLGSGWVKGDDNFYYYTAKVEEGLVNDLTSSITASATSQPPSEDYKLKVQVIVQTIQAEGRTDNGDIPAVEDAWGVTVNSDGTITP